jgi:hypothetical protein
MVKIMKPLVAITFLAFGIAPMSPTQAAQSSEVCADFRGYYACKGYDFGAQGYQSESNMEVLQEIDSSTDVSTITYAFHFKYWSENPDPAFPDRKYTNGKESVSSAFMSPKGEYDSEAKIIRTCKDGKLELINPEKPSTIQLHFIEPTPKGARDYVVTVNGKEVQRCFGSNP